jgi:hypothetical protein
MSVFRLFIQPRNGARFFRLRLVAIFFLLLSWTASAGNFYAGTSPANVPWPGGIVPYQFTNTLTAAQTNTYLAGLREWELAANVKFVPHTNQSRWILFTYNTNFQDSVSGGSYSPQMVTVSSLSRAQVGHEMGHSFGFNHENIRPDAAHFISVLTNNIIPADLFYFQIDPTTVTDGPYDYESVMHLGWDFASTNFGVLATQQPKPPNFPRYQFRMGNFCLSPGDRAALAFLYGPPAVPLTNVVTTAADVGPGSLRAAIYYAADHPGATIKFNLNSISDPGYSNGVFNIHLTGMLPPLAANGLVIDGSTQPGFVGKPLIVLDASQIIPETFTSDTMLIYSSSNQIKNISFTGFDWNGITLVYADATNNTIAGCWLGVDATGTNAAPNAYQGILLASGASGNVIGGAGTLARNVISGNAQYGVCITDSNTTGNIVLGNYIGTDASGSNALANQLSGVLIGGGASGNTVGGNYALTRNIISGNAQYGIYLTNTTGNFIYGHYLGVNVVGQTAVANALSGIALFGGSQNSIGGPGLGEGNVLSGNGNYGLDIRNPVATKNIVQLNLIGLGAPGTNGVGNALGGVHLGSGAQSNTIGTMLARNVISGNGTAGVFLTEASTSGNLIQGNYIGTDITGTNAFPNTLAGVYLPDGASGNVIGGTSQYARNVISGNYYGVYIAGAGGGNVIEGNYIGVTPDGTRAVGSAFTGVILFGGTTNNLIGGTTSGAANVLSGFWGYGVYIAGAGTAGNVVQGNVIGADATGTNALGNGYANILLQLGTTNNIIGGTGAGAGNEIAFSGGAGVLLLNAETTNNAIRGNSIFSNGYLGINFSNTTVAPNHTGFLAGPNNMQNYPVITQAFGAGFSSIVQGTLNSLAGRNYSVDVYRSPAADVSGYGQGQFYVGTVSATTDGSGNATFALTNNSGNFAGQYFSTTATDASGNTSEFSADVLATNVPAAAAQFGPPFVGRTNGFIFNLTLVTNFSYRIQATTNLATNPIPWVNLTNFTATASSLTFTDRTATNFRTRFYRVVSP